MQDASVWAVSKTDTSCMYCVQSSRSISEEINIIRSLEIDRPQFLHKMGEVGVWEIRNSFANKNSVWQGSRSERNTIKITIPLISECSLCLVMTKWWTQTLNPKCLIKDLGHHPQSHHWKIQRRPSEWVTLTSLCLLHSHGWWTLLLRTLCVLTSLTNLLHSHLDYQTEIWYQYLFKGG